MQGFDHVRAWIFDLDNTLYPPTADLFAQIEVRMTAWIMRNLDLDREAADLLRHDYWGRYGTTLAGLMAEHDLEADDFLRDVHDVTLDRIAPDATLCARIAALPGRRIVFTNGSAAYAERVLHARGLSVAFDAVYGIEHAGYRPKPERVAYDAVFARDGLDPRRAAMFEDVARNLVAPFEMGMRTVLVAPRPEPAAHIHHQIDDLSDFLSRLA